MEARIPQWHNKARDSNHLVCIIVKQLLAGGDIVCFCFHPMPRLLRFYARSSRNLITFLLAVPAEIPLLRYEPELSTRHNRKTPWLTVVDGARLSPMRYSPSLWFELTEANNDLAGRLHIPHREPRRQRRSIRRTHLPRCGYHSFIEVYTPPASQAPFATLRSANLNTNKIAPSTA